MDPDCAVWAAFLGKRYRSGGVDVQVFEQLSLRVRSGERLAIVGESGAGKSTLLHLLGGLERPTTGKIGYGGLEITNMPDDALADFRNRHVGFVWQIPSLLPEFTATENVMMPLLIRGVAPDVARREALACLREVGLEHRSAHQSGELSGGEQQRVALARALVTKPKVILADEPTGNLDFRTGETIMNLLTDLHTSHQLTSVFVTHNLEFAARCDRVLELKKGGLGIPSPTGSPVASLVQDATRLGGGTYV